MAIALYFDVHVDRAIAAQLRIRQVDVLTAQEDDAARLTDAELLDRATRIGRPIVTHDIRFHRMAEAWQKRSQFFCGVIFGHIMQISIGQCVRDLELIAKATEPTDWQSVIVRLPL